MMAAPTSHKVMLLGEIGVGKSSLARRLVFDRFDGAYKPTIGVEVSRYGVSGLDEGPDANLILWDTDGNFGQAIFQHVYLKDAAAAMIVGDQTRTDTLDTMVSLAEGFRAVRPGRVISFVVNKADLPVPGGTLDLPPALLRYCDRVTRTSALLGDNVADAFRQMTVAIRRRG
jgi:Ras-related protein Rab-5C